MNRYLLIVISMFLFILSCDSSTQTEDTKLVANAGEDQTTIVGSYAIFDPTNSTGNYGWLEWKQDENNPDTVRILSHSRDSDQFLNIHKVAFVKEGVYKFKLRVKKDYNDNSRSEYDELVITVNPNLNSKFEDPNLEATVRVKIDLQTEELTDDVLLNLDSLQYMPTPDRITSLSGIEYCRNLIYLQMGSQSIENISPLAELKKLRILGLDQNRKITDVSPLAELTELEWLNLDSNLLTDISALRNLSQLKYLNLQLNSITNIDAIKDMKELETLEFFRASFTDISALASLNNLRQLWIVESKLIDISILSRLQNITNLHLAWNQIVDISALSSIEKLEWVALEKNNISNISSLKGLKSLGYLRLWDNQITDIKPLVDNSDIGEGDIVGLNGNPLNEKSINEYIPALQSHGVLVTW